MCCSADTVLLSAELDACVGSSVDSVYTVPQEVQGA
jgi:hypothetical protein